MEQYINGALEGKKRKSRIKSWKAEEELEKGRQDAVNLTDPETRFMKNKKKHTELSYNYQITVNQETGLILATSISQDPTNHHQLQPQIKQLEENLGKPPPNTKVSSDNGLFHRRKTSIIWKREN